MICYNVSVIGVIHINKLNMKLFKHEELVLNKNNIDYSKEFDKILFEIDEEKYSLNNNNNNNEIIFTKENEDYLFLLELKDNNFCSITLKKENATLPINVEDAYIEKKDNIIIIKYQLESDDKTTTIELNI